MASQRPLCTGDASLEKSTELSAKQHSDTVFALAKRTSSHTVTDIRLPWDM